MTSIKINDKELLFVPDEGIFYNFRIGKAGPNKGHLFASCIVTYGKKWELPDPGSWLLLGKGSEISEEQAKGIVEVHKHLKRPVKYDHDEGAPFTVFTCSTFTESLRSLIRSHGHEPEEVVVLIKQ